MEKVPGCWEHMSTVWDLLQKAHSEKLDLFAIWLNIANAYGSVPHRLIFFVLRRYGVPESWIDLVVYYYNGLWSKSFSTSPPSSWHHHKRGIFIGCTVSIILFLVAINVIIEYTCVALDPMIFPSPTAKFTPIKAFMDDLHLMSTSISETQVLPNRCTTALS